MRLPPFFLLRRCHDGLTIPRCLSIARGHSLLSAARESLALLSRALALSSQALPVLSSNPAPPTTLTSAAASNDQESLLTLEIRRETAKAVHNLLQGELTRQHALVELSDQLSSGQSKSSDPIPSLIENLDHYPLNHGGTHTNTNSSGSGSGSTGSSNNSPAATVNLNNLVIYPPQLEPVPVKPLFLDVAWNYIDYPGRARRTTPSVPSGANAPPSAAAAAAGTTKDKQQQQQQQSTAKKDEEAKAKEGKRGWFSFGRG